MYAFSEIDARSSKDVSLKAIDFHGAKIIKTGNTFK